MHSSIAGVGGCAGAAFILTYAYMTYEKVGKTMLKYLELLAKRRQTRNELNSLSDRELADIGISRYDIEQIVADTVIH